MIFHQEQGAQRRGCWEVHVGEMFAMCVSHDLQGEHASAGPTATVSSLSSPLRLFKLQSKNGETGKLEPHSWSQPARVTRRAQDEVEQQ